MRRAWLLFLACLLLCDTGFSQTPQVKSFESVREELASIEIQIALRLYGEADDYRAITSLKRWMVLDDTSLSLSLGPLMIGQIYSRNQQPRLAFENFVTASSAMGQESAEWAQLLALQELCVGAGAWSECDLGLSKVLEQNPKSERRPLVLYLRSLTAVMRAESLVESQVVQISDAELRTRALELVARRKAYDELPFKTPWLAGTMSAVLPGAGQAYNGRWIDAGLSLVLTGGFGALTWYTWDRWESIPWTVVLGSVTAGFWVGNIVNAVVDSGRINQRLSDDFFRETHEKYWPRIGFDIDQETVQFHWTFQ